MCVGWGSWGRGGVKGGTVAAFHPGMRYLDKQGITTLHYSMTVRHSIDAQVWSAGGEGEGVWMP